MDSTCKPPDAWLFDHEADIGCNRVFVLLIGGTRSTWVALDIMKVAGAEPTAVHVFELAPKCNMSSPTLVPGIGDEPIS